MFEIGVKGRFSAAHQLKGYAGKCAVPHGHNWDVEVFLRGNELASSGMLLDFQEIKRALGNILGRFDHTDLNTVDILKGMNPTSENIAKVIYHAMANEMKETACHVHRVCVHETPETAASYFEES